MLGDLNVNKIFLLDEKKMWYLKGFDKTTNNVSTSVKLLEKYIDDMNVKKVTCIGTSAGGYAAILYGALLAVDQVIVYGAQTFLDKDTRVKYNDNRWETRIDKIYRFKNLHKYLNLNKYITKAPNTTFHLYLCKNCELDASHIWNIITNKNINIHAYECKKNNVSEFLKKRNLLLDTLKDVNL